MARAPFQVLVVPFRPVRHTVEFCILRRADGGWWQWVAGGGKDDENPVAAAEREAHEELGTAIGPARLFGLDCRASVPVAAFAARTDWPSDLFTIPEYSFAVEVSGQVTLSEEHAEFRWCSFDEAWGSLHWQSNQTALWELSERLEHGALRPASPIWRDDATLAGARTAAAGGRLETWVHDYLNGPGRNVPMSRGLLGRQRWWVGPLLVPIDELNRCVGPEPAMAFPRLAKDWDPRLAGIERSVDAGWDAPPIIVEARTDGLLVCDGNHRYEAFRRMGRTEVWALVWFNDEPTWQSFDRAWAAGAHRTVGEAR